MVAVCRMTVVFGVILLMTATATAADEKVKPEKNVEVQRPAVRAVLDNFTQLLPRGAEEKLKLTAEQKKEIGKIQDDYQAAVKEAMGALRDGALKARQDKDKQAIRDLGQQIMSVFKARGEFMDKVEKVLTDEQKKTFSELRKETPGGKFGQRFEKLGQRKKG